MVRPTAITSAFLASLRTRRLDKIVTRCVPQLEFDAGHPPRYFFPSRRPNRLNPVGIECLYFSDGEDVANAEYRYQWMGTPAEHQPKIVFHASALIRRCLDLGDPSTLAALGLTDRDVFGV